MGSQSISAVGRGAGKTVELTLLDAEVADEIGVLVVIDSDAVLLLLLFTAVTLDSGMQRK